MFVVRDDKRLFVVARRRPIGPRYIYTYIHTYIRYMYFRERDIDIDIDTLARVDWKSTVGLLGLLWLLWLLGLRPCMIPLITI